MITNVLCGKSVDICYKQIIFLRGMLPTTHLNIHKTPTNGHNFFVFYHLHFILVPKDCLFHELSNGVFYEHF